jgi:hypothetical protein
VEAEGRAPVRELLSIEETRIRLKTSRWTVRRLVDAGELEQVWVTPHRRRIVALSVEDFIGRGGVGGDGAERQQAS